MSSVDVFNYGGHEVRTVLVDGEPWFVAVDVTRVLGLTNTSLAVSRLDPDGVSGAEVIDGMGRPQFARIVSEAGLYELIFQSRREEAKAFRRWVTHEVLPELRRTGAYEIQPSHRLPQTYAEALRELADTAERAEAAEREVAALAPPAAAWNDLASASGDYTVSDAAKILARGGIGTGPRKLYEYLANDAGWVFRRGGRWQAMQAAINSGYVVERITGGYWDDQSGERKQGDPQVRITAKGVEKLFDLMRGQRALAVVNQ